MTNIFVHIQEGHTPGIGNGVQYFDIFRGELESPSTAAVRVAPRHFLAACHRPEQFRCSGLSRSGDQEDVRVSVEISIAKFEWER